jgi:ribosomal protein S18 acetylase RimI-like enzyme
MLIAKLPRLLQAGDITLRPLRMWDGPSLSRALMSEDLLKCCGLTRPLDLAWPFFYRRLRAMYPIAYCIEFACETAGFIGLYNLRPDKSAEMSLIIFSPLRRRAGLGTTSFHLLSSALERNNLVRRWIVSVMRDNDPAYSFWKKLGFEEIQHDDGKTIRMALSNCNA